MKSKPKKTARTRGRATNPPPDVTPAREAFGCPVVGVGASAGGLEAFTALLKRLPSTTGLGFVLVQHLDPNHESALTHILARATTMPVHEVTDSLRVEANHVYVIPPNAGLSITRGVLKLHPRPEMRAGASSIDSFFESLAQDQHERAIGVILSGTASDGTVGLEMIKAEGGITFAQDDSAAYDSMPRSAVGAGCVDFVMSPAGIADELAQIAKHPYVSSALETRIPAVGNKESLAQSDKAALPAQGGVGNAAALKGRQKSPANASAVTVDTASGYQKILLHLRKHTGVDFSLYKTPTIHRRIARRMVLNRHETPESYADFVHGNPKELDALYADALINVTSFFRNAEAFAVLQQKVFPKLLRQRGEDPLRVWVLGCSTGQEAYSIAIALTESAEKAGRTRKLQVFATDLNEANLVKARHGLYAKSVMQDVSPTRLRRFFVEEEGGFRVVKALRELVVFARQNLISDPPFSRMDLICCRNLMIYLEPSLQKKALPAFHYALKPEGFLFLGASESIGTFNDLFEPVDKKQKIFSRKAAPTLTFRLPLKKEPRDLLMSAPVGRPSSYLANKRESLPEGFHGELNAEREADRVAVNRFAPPAVLINDALQILQFRGPTSAFLVPPTGKANFDLLKMAREGLLLPLRATINRARKEKRIARTENVSFELNNKIRRVNVEVVPLKNLKDRCFLVSFEESPTRGLAESHAPSLKTPDRTETKPGRVAAKEKADRVASLERELAETRDYLQSVQEQHEVSAEELQASHEESQSANEELQSINEEMETSKEELESTNEELTTVNEEMANRNTELNRLNSDLTNLQASTKLVILLLGRDLTLRRFSLQAEKQFNLLPTDIGRPLGNIRHNLELPDLESFIAEVITSVRERECEVRDKQGRWHALHVRPYLTIDNRVDGAVLVLVDITAIKESEQAVIAERDFAEAIISAAPDPLLILDANLRVQRANVGFYSTFKVTPAESIGRTVFELNHGHWDIPKLRQLLQEILPLHSFFNNFEVTHDFENIGRRTMLLNARALSEAKGQPARILLGIKDVSELLQFESQMRHSELRYRRLFEAGKDGVLIVDAGTRKIIDANPFMTELLGYPHDALVGKELFEIGLLKDEAASRAAFLELQKRGFIRYENLPLETKTGQRREVEFVSNLYEEGGGPIIQCSIRDVTARKKTERELSEKARLLDLSNDAIIVCALDDKIRLWNKGAEKLYGWSGEEVIGKPCLALLQTEFSKPKDEIDEQLRRDGEFNGEVVQIARDGRRVPSLCRWVLDVGGESILTSYTDITARKTAEVEMAQERDKAVLASRAKDDFLAALSHELRTPLNPVLLIATDGARDPAYSAEARAAFGIIVKNALLEARLIDDLLDLTKITHGKMSLQMEQVDVQAVLQDAITTMGTEFEEKKIALTLDLISAPCAVTGDPVRLQQVFWNVLKNAVKFTPTGGKIHIETRLSVATDEVTVTVTDSGIGMTPDELSRIFVAFAQGDHAVGGGFNRFGGLGLGLRISRMLVQMHTGRLTATSGGRNRGTAFSIVLPLAGKQSAKKSSTVTAPPLNREIAAHPSLGMRRILLVEDHDATRTALAALLARRGHRVAAAASVGQALTLAAAQPFDLVLSDIGLPDGDGCDLMRELRDRYALRGIAMTGYGMEDDITRTRESGFIAHLTKPVSIQSLEAAVASVVIDEKSGSQRT